MVPGFAAFAPLWPGSITTTLVPLIGWGAGAGAGAGAGSGSGSAGGSGSGSGSGSGVSSGSGAGAGSGSGVGSTVDGAGTTSDEEGDGGISELPVAELDRPGTVTGG